MSGSGVIRFWACMNARCGAQFESWEANPECPTCRCVRVQWIPGGGHVAGTAKAADAELRALADVFKMTDMNSGERGRAAKQVAPQAVPHAGPSRQFAPGFSAAAPPDRAVCVPSSSNVNFKATVGIGNKLAPSKVFANPSTNTVFEARHAAGGAKP